MSKRTDMFYKGRCPMYSQQEGKSGLMNTDILREWSLCFITAEFEETGGKQVLNLF